MTTITFRLKGGSGSGNFGHSGRPGKIGGSSGGGASWGELGGEYLTSDGSFKKAPDGWHLQGVPGKARIIVSKTADGSSVEIGYGGKKNLKLYVGNSDNKYGRPIEVKFPSADFQSVVTAIPNMSRSSVMAQYKLQEPRIRRPAGRYTPSYDSYGNLG